MLKSLLFFFGLAIAALTAQAYEVDDFYCAQKLASQPQAVSKDVEARLNAFTEEKLKEAVEAINGKILEEIEKGRVNHTTCDDWGTKYNYLLKSVRKRLSSGVISELENFASENLQGQVCRVDKSQSIYAGHGGGIFGVLDVLDSIGVRAALGETVKICGVITGTDKLGHFFGEGMDLLPYGRDVRGVFNFGKAYKQNRKYEDGVLGTDSTGVFSFGDMSASVQGTRFFDTIVKYKHGSVAEKPTIYCSKVKKVVNGAERLVPAFVYNEQKPFRWCDHVNHSWDESLNCSDYTPQVKAIVENNMKAKGYTCPREARLCREAYASLYSSFNTLADEFFHPASLRAAKRDGTGQPPTKGKTPGSQ